MGLCGHCKEFRFDSKYKRKPLDSFKKKKKKTKTQILFIKDFGAYGIAGGRIGRRKTR